jgi:hypothetical protein
MGRRIGGAGGGSDKGTSSNVVVGTVAAIAIASAGGGVGAGVGAVSGSSSGTVAESVAGRNIAAKKANGKKSASRGKADEAWERMGMRGVRKKVQRNLPCVVNSFGQVREFFLRTPCKALDRALFAVDDGRGDLVVVSVAWVSFRTRAAAERFKDLDDTYGTGNITPLGGALLGLADVRFTGQHYQSRRAGTMIVIAEAEPLDGTQEDIVLDTVAEVAMLLPRL